MARIELRRVSGYDKIDRAGLKIVFGSGWSWSRLKGEIDPENNKSCLSEATTSAFDGREQLQVLCNSLCEHGLYICILSINHRTARHGRGGGCRFCRLDIYIIFQDGNIIYS